jgi:hypothetical protein
MSRQPAPEKETKGQRKQRERESLIWEQSVRGIGPAPVGSQWIYVGDRGSDIFPFWQACQTLGYDFTVRVAQDRGMVGHEAEIDDDPSRLASEKSCPPVACPGCSPASPARDSGTSRP